MLEATYTPGRIEPLPVSLQPRNLPSKVSILLVSTFIIHDARSIDILLPINSTDPLSTQIRNPIFSLVLK